MDDLIRRMAEQDEMMRRLVEDPLRQLRQAEEAIARMATLPRGLDISVLDKAAVAATTAELTDFASAALTNLKTPAFLTAMDSYALEARKVQEMIESLGQAPRIWADQIAAFSSCVEATRTHGSHGIPWRARVAPAGPLLPADHGRLRAHVCCAQHHAA
jgi:hypothetical protein